MKNHRNHRNHRNPLKACFAVSWLALCLLLGIACDSSAKSNDKGGGSLAEGDFISRFDRLASVPPVHRIEEDLKRHISLRDADGRESILARDLSVYDPCELRTSVAGSVVVGAAAFNYTGDILQPSDISYGLLQVFQRLYDELCSLKHQESFLREIKEAEARFKAQVLERKRESEEEMRILEEEGYDFHGPELTDQEVLDELNQQSSVTFNSNGSIGLGYYWPGDTPAEDVIQKSIWTRDRIKYVYDGYTISSGELLPFLLTLERRIDGSIDHSKIRSRILDSSGNVYYERAISIVLDTSSGTAMVRYGNVWYFPDGNVKQHRVVTHKFFSDGTALANAYVHYNTTSLPNRAAVEDINYMEYRTIADGRIEITPLYYEYISSSDGITTGVETITGSPVPAWVSALPDLSTLFPPLGPHELNSAALMGLVNNKVEYIKNTDWQWPRNSEAVQEVKDMLLREGVPGHSSAFQLEADFLSEAWDSEGL